MTHTSMSFLQERIPDALNIENKKDALILIEDYIDQNGFAPPDYYDYNDLGREAQKVYDDIYLSN